MKEIKETLKVVRVILVYVFVIIPFFTIYFILFVFKILFQSLYYFAGYLQYLSEKVVYKILKYF
jgi:hypothetical protein